MSLLGLSVVASTALAAERRYAVVIGANRGDVYEIPLQYAERDAERFADVMKDLGGVQASDLVLLKMPDAQEVREALRETAQRIANEAVASGEKSTLFLYYSGHADAADLHLGGSRLPLAELKRYVDDSPADVRVLFVDACRTGELIQMRGGVPDEAFPVTINERLALEGTAIITSAAPGEDAQESSRLAGGVFTHHLISGLQGAADTSGDHRVSLQEAVDYSANRTTITTSSAPVLQRPSQAINISGQGTFVLTELDGARRTGQLRLADAGEYIVYPLQGRANVTEFEVADGGMIVLPHGDYELRRRTPRHVYESVFTITEGEVTTLTAEQLEEIPYGKVARRGYSEGKTGSGAIVMGTDLATPKWMGESFTAPEPFLGFRFEVPDGSIQLRVRYNQDNFITDQPYTDIETDQYSLGLDAAGFYMADWRRIAYGIGIRAGAEYINQSFETTGDAPTRHNVLGHVDVVPRIEVQPLPRISVGLEGGAAGYLIPNAEDTLGTGAPGGEDSRAYRSEIVFYVGLDISVFLF